MNKRLSVFLIITLLSLPLLFSSSISFSGGESRLVMREGEKSVTLKSGAEVTTGSLFIKAEEMSLSGDDWKTISAKGDISVTDSERGIEINTESLWFDRSDELLVISSWFEIDDTKEELYAQAGSLRYDMKNEKLEMGMQVTLFKIAEGDVMKCTSESVTYDKSSGMLTLKGGAKVVWKGDNYEAEIITVDTNDNTIALSGRIKGTING